MIYLKLSTFADMLSAELLSQIHDEMNTGYFVMDIAYPWRVWWAVPQVWYSLRKNKFYKSLPWEEDTPPGEVVRVEWGELLRHIAIEEDSSEHIATNIVIRTGDKRVFNELIHKHFMLQQGEIFYACMGKEFFCKIASPSLWCLSLLRGDFILYNQVEAIDGLYLQRGWRPCETFSQQKLHISAEQLFLLQSNGDVKAYDTAWENASRIIDIIGGEVSTLTVEESVRITVKPRLIDEEEQEIPELWRVDDEKKLVSILQNTAYEQLHGFKVWLSQQPPFFILAEGKQADTGVKTVLTDAFPSYIRYHQRVFFCRGKTFLPRLPESKILDIYHVHNDYLGIDEEQVWKLEEAKLKNLDSFIDFAAERVVAKLEDFSSQWQFDFPQLRQTPILLGGVDTPAAKGKKEEKNAPLANAVQKAKKLFTTRRITRRDRQEDDHWKDAIRAIDRQLLENITDAELWTQRAQLSKALGNRDSALVAQLTSFVITRDQRQLLQALANDMARYGLDFASAKSDEEKQGKLLAAIRTTAFSAELNYALQLYFATYFADEDVLRYAIAAMRSGYHDSRKAFQQFEDFDVSIEASRQTQQALTPERRLDIQRRAEEFMQAVQSAPAPLPAIIGKQFQVLLQINVGDEIIQVQPPRNLTRHWQWRWQSLESYPNLDIFDPAQSTEMWYEKVAMRNVKGSNIENLFTGDLYRPLFTFEFREEAMAEIEVIYGKYLRGEDWKSYFAEDTSEIQNARNQRTLLYLVTQYGPLEQFRQVILPLSAGRYFYEMVMNCDIYRLSLMYRQKFDEDRFFQRSLQATQQLDNLFDFRDAMENLALCLFLYRGKKSRKYFFEALKQIIEWLKVHLNEQNPVYADELLSLLAYFQVYIVFRELPDMVATYNFYSRKKSLWMDHANFLNSQGLALLQQDFAR